MYIGFCTFLRTISTFGAPIILFALVNYSIRNERNLDGGLSIVRCLILVKLVEILFKGINFF